MGRISTFESYERLPLENEMCLLETFEGIVHCLALKYQLRFLILFFGSPDFPGEGGKGQNKEK